MDEKIIPLVVDQNYYENFVYYVLPELGPDEVYFLSLSARNKYLSPEERAYYGLGRTEMFARTLVKSKKDFDYTMGKLASTLTYKTTRNGMSIPAKALVVYVNINPSSAVRAYQLFATEMESLRGDVVNALLKNKQPPNLDGFKYADRKLLNCFQKATGNRYWLDIDMDVATPTIVDELTAKLVQHNIRHYQIKTQGGWHVLICRGDLSISGYQLHKTVTDLNRQVVATGGEVVFNKNAMVPLPGTTQAGELVEMF